MKVNQITRCLLVISVVAVLFDLVRFFMHVSANPFYLIWNLFLAWIPYVIAVYFIKKETPAGRFILFFILWLLFLPNAPYLATDVLHLASSPGSLLWYDGLLFFFFGWIGLLLGTLSLFTVHQYFQTRFSRLTSEIFIFLICFISSFGVYLGRFERWNSWDVFVNPLSLVKHSFNLSTNLTHPGTPLLFMILFTVFLYAVYKMIYAMLESREVF